MSWRSINDILGLATIDVDFCQQLLQDPLTAIHAQGFTLEAEEEQLLSTIHADNIYEFSQQLLERCRPSSDR